VPSIQRNVTGRLYGCNHAPEREPTIQRKAQEEAGDNDKVENYRLQRLPDAGAVRVPNLAPAAEQNKESDSGGGDVADRRPQRTPVAGTVHISGPALCARYGIVGMTLHRWERNQKLGFPKPRWINNRKYWALAEIEAWERSRVPHTGTEG
jgi:hypothetical protein